MSITYELRVEGGASEGEGERERTGSRAGKRKEGGVWQCGGGAKRGSKQHLHNHTPVQSGPAPQQRSLLPPRCLLLNFQSHSSAVEIPPLSPALTHRHTHTSLCGGVVIVLPRSVSAATSHAPLYLHPSSFLFRLIILKDPPSSVPPTSSLLPLCCCTLCAPPPHRRSLISSACVLFLRHIRHKEKNIV